MMNSGYVNNLFNQQPFLGGQQQKGTTSQTNANNLSYNQGLSNALNMSTAQSDNSALLSVPAPKQGIVGQNASFQISGSSISFANDESSILGSASHETSSTIEQQKKTNRRTAKEEDKVSKKLNDSGDKNSKKSNSFQIPENFGKGKGGSTSNEESHTGKNDTTYDQLNKLTNKKREYLDQAIIDKNGAYLYEEDPHEYKKARKRLQNRESAVRSRLRKKTHQDELETRIEELEKLQKEISEQNAGLSAQNELLKKQLAFFEDVFAKSQLLGYENQISKDKFAQYQVELLKKIDSKLEPVQQTFKVQNQPEVNDNSLELFPSSQSRNILDDADSFSTTSLSGGNTIKKQLSGEHHDSLLLVRSRSNSSSFSNSGYLFLAVVFAMMCCSAFIMGPTSFGSVANQIKTANTFSDSGAINFYSGKGLKDKQNFDQNQVHSTLTDSLDDETPLTLSEITQKRRQSKSKLFSSSLQENSAEPTLGAIQLLKLMIQGQYTYLTYMLLSVTCFFFWVMPNTHKIRSMFSSIKSQNSGPRQIAVANVCTRTIVTRSQSKANAKKDQ